MSVRFRAGIGPLPSEEYANWVPGTPCPECERPARMKLALYLPKARDGSPVAYAFEHESGHCQQYSAEDGLRRLREAGLVEEIE